MKRQYVYNQPNGYYNQSQPNGYYNQNQTNDRGFVFPFLLGTLTAPLIYGPRPTQTYYVYPPYPPYPYYYQRPPYYY